MHGMHCHVSGTRNYLLPSPVGRRSVVGRCGQQGVDLRRLVQQQQHDGLQAAQPEAARGAVGGAGGADERLPRRRQTAAGAADEVRPLLAHVRQHLRWRP